MHTASTKNMGHPVISGYTPAAEHSSDLAEDSVLDVLLSDTSTREGLQRIENPNVD